MRRSPHLRTLCDKARFVTLGAPTFCLINWCVRLNEVVDQVSLDSKTVQPRYNLLFRQIEQEMLPYCIEEKIAVLP